MAYIKFNTLKSRSILGLICATVPVFFFWLWLHAIELGDTHTESATIFQAFLPELLKGRWLTTYVSIAFGILAIIFVVPGLKTENKGWKLFSFLIFIVSGLLLLLNGFALM